MGLLDKVESSEKEVVKKEPVKAAKAAKAAKVAKAAPVKAKKEKKKKEKKPRPASLSDEFEIAPKLSRIISWWVNFTVNFSLIITAVFLNAYGGGAGNGGVAGTIVLIAAFAVWAFNSIFLPFNTGRNLGQFTSSTRNIRGDGSKPMFLHPLLANNIGLLSLIGFLLIFTQVGKISDGGTGPIVATSLGAIFMILWIVNWQFSRNSDLNQGLFDLMFGTYLVRYIPEEKATSGFRARLESMSQFGEKYAKRVEEKAKAREAKVAEKDSEDDKGEEEAEDNKED
ncbi:MAG: hypothetical protein CMA41_01165 [Euryarchaeota archaeon]|jgi:hypothetical protein|nr:hypothetical protein [Euryarchaeota archaeon]MBF14622.1 hypothetical protein [Euryarchaeota archaeon]|tara:strand:- start:322 stop:1170 length:849 start_codon:yes stop_codon:yes gene_type:complete